MGEVEIGISHWNGWPPLQQSCLHWLLLQSRVDFKLACFVYSSLSGQAPPYMADDIHFFS